ncbi:MAG: hypothetical protein LBG43_00145 [Treponema sp.]|jgi:hypothetical protein|nr:hypothetical protein [Treponema sp.]
MNPPFGDIREWETALLTLPEESFFSLVRSILGSVKTPFSKQRLVDDLKAFLSNEENRKALEAYIDEKDALLIASVAVLENPTEQELTDFIGGELTGNVHAFLINMEERLIVYRFKKGRITYIALNPLLEGVLGKFAQNTRRLFPSVSRVSRVSPREEPETCLPVIDDRFIAASFSFALEKAGARGNGSGPRRNASCSSKTGFPYAVQYGAGALQVLELLYTDDANTEEKLDVNARNVERFGNLSPRERLEYYITGVYLYQHKTGSLHQRFSQFKAFHQGQIKTIAAFVHQLLDFFTGAAIGKAARRYPRITLQRIAVLLQRKGLGADQDRSVSLPNLEALLSCLETLGILISDESSLWLLNPAVLGESPRNEPQTVLTMDTEFSCILYPGIDFRDALNLAFFSEVREMGAVVRFELTRESVVRGFDRGISADAMIRLLNRLSGGQVSHNARYCLNDWEDRRRSVSLHHGLVLCLDEERRYLAEIEPFSRFIARSLAPGVYLLCNIERSDVLKALRHVGVDIVAQNMRSVRGGISGAKSVAFSAFASDDYEMRFPALASSDLSPLLIGETDAREEALSLQPEQAALYLERFRRALDNSPVPKSKREELKVHIENRLILNEKQLSEDCVSYTKTEAHLLDQAGKISIIRDAVMSKSTLNVRWITMDKNGERQGGGHGRRAERHAAGIPKKLEKSEGKQMLFLETQEGETLIPLRKILYIRKVKKSIFE